MKTVADIGPFKNCPAMDGYHCQTGSLAKIYRFYGHPLSEEMLLGLGSGMGFIYWKMKIGEETYIFIGGRGNNKEFFNDIGKRTGVKIDLVTTSSAGRAEAALLEKLAREEPVMLFGDMCFLPWFDFPQEYHFGGHTFVVCGYDAESGRVLASDMDQAAAGLKKGYYYPVSLEQLKKARSSPFKPFPPKNASLEFDFGAYRDPRPDDIYSAIGQTADAQLHPPIKNIGVKGLRLTSKELLKWPGMFDDHDLRMNLFSIYIYIEIGGTGGGCFRYMYARFLREAAAITRDDRLVNTADEFQKSGVLFSEIGNLFRESEKVRDLDDRIRRASDLYREIAGIEEDAFEKAIEISS